MQESDIISASIESVRLHKEERKIAGATYGTYESHYIAKLVEYPKGIAVVDSLATQLHPDWDKKTGKRAELLGTELAGEQYNFKVIDIFPSGDFEAALV